MVAVVKNFSEPLFIFGMPRSGTTWLAKIFDSHPGTFYLHEPDQAIAETAGLPAYCDPAQVGDQLSAAQAFLAAMMSVRTPKAAASLPLFAKQYRSLGRARARMGIIAAVKAAELVTGGRWCSGLAIPDLIDWTRGPIVPVVKSVRALGQLPLLLGAAPGSRAILIIRNPAGHIASVLRFRGRAAAQDAGIYRDLAATEQARGRGLSEKVLLDLPPLDRLAWRWALANEKALADIRRFRLPVRVIRYEDLCQAPSEVARGLFEFAGLAWRPDTALFTAASTLGGGDGRYYGVFRNPRRSALRWREDLSPADIARIFSITDSTEPGALFAEQRSLAAVAG